MCKLSKRLQNKTDLLVITTPKCQCQTKYSGLAISSMFTSREKKGCCVPRTESKNQDVPRIDKKTVLHTDS